MKTSFKNTSGMAAIMLAGVAMFGVNPATATAQVYGGGVFAPGPYSYTWYVPPYSSGATAYESFLRGQATVMQAEGERALNWEKARVRAAEADSRMLDNREKAFEQRLQFRRRGIAERNVAYESVQDRRNLNMALTDAERLLEESESAIGPHETRAAAKLRLAKSLLESDQRSSAAMSTVAVDE